MTKTVNYNLNKPEAGDPIRVADFNGNADIIDGALAGMPKIQTGTYAGTGTYGENNPVTLNFNFLPKFVMVWCDYQPHVLLAICGENATVRYDNSAWTNPATWGEQSVSWYTSSSAKSQLNEESRNYYYMALG